MQEYTVNVRKKKSKCSCMCNELYQTCKNVVYTSQQLFEKEIKE